MCDNLGSMIITVASFKGGVGKTTTAIHLAGYLQGQGNTLLVDGDSNRSAVQWAASDQLPFTVADEMEAPKLLMGGQYAHVVIDTAARPSADELASLQKGCDLLILPCSPDALSMGALFQMIPQLAGSKGAYKVLLTLIPPRPSTIGTEARDALEKQGIPLFQAQIRRLAAFQKAALEGRIVNAISDRYSGIAWNCYTSLGKEINNE